MPNQIPKILLIEDNPGDARLVRELLIEANADFLIEHASHFAAGLERLKQKDIRIILMDLLLPDSEGIEGFTRLKEEAPDVPVLILTGFGDEELGLAAVRAGAEDYLFKGEMDPALLLRSIRYAIERHEIKRNLDALSQRLQTANEDLEKLALLDPLTSLLNRRGLEQVLMRETSNSAREKCLLLLLIIDIDDFKSINDTYGYSAGDSVLKEVAKRAQGILRATDFVARLGGDEFLVLLSETRIAEGLRVAEKVRLAISAQPLLIIQDKQVHVTVSIGVVTLSSPVRYVDELLLRSNAALRASKKLGKNRICIERKDHELGDMKEIIEPVIESLKEASFKVVSQPIVRVSDKMPVAHELLSRSQIDGFEMPDDFFRVSTENDFLQLLDRKCFKTCGSYAAAALQDLPVHINLFPATLATMPIDDLLDLLPKGIKKERVCIEISEQQILGDPSYLTAPCAELRKRGVLIAIEDIGFGRSSLESLVLIEPQVVKIDKKCIQGVAKSEFLQRSLKRLLNALHALGAQVIAEGIETQADFEAVRALGVEWVQGYLTGPPA